jgi:hypothetical protein
LFGYVLNTALFNIASNSFDVKKSIGKKNKPTKSSNFKSNPQSRANQKNRLYKGSQTLALAGCLQQTKTNLNYNRALKYTPQTRHPVFLL